MIKTVEAVVDEQGTVRLTEHVDLPCARRALVTILDEEPAVLTPEPALLSERALRRTGTGQRRMPRGHTCIRIGSAGAVPFFRSLAGETATGSRDGGRRQT